MVRVKAKTTFNREEWMNFSRDLVNNAEKEWFDQADRVASNLMVQIRSAHMTYGMLAASIYTRNRLKSTYGSVLADYLGIYAAIPAAKKFKRGFWQRKPPVDAVPQPRKRGVVEIASIAPYGTEETSELGDRMTAGDIWDTVTAEGAVDFLLLRWTPILKSTEMWYDL